MNFPYTKSRLQDLHAEYYMKEEEAFIADVSDHISQLVISKAISTSKRIQTGVIITNLSEKRHITVYFKNVLRVSNRALEMPRESYIPRIISTIEERFPDCVISVDPLKTYIIINWG